MKKGISSFNGKNKNSARIKKIRNDGETITKNMRNQNIYKIRK